MAVTADLQLHPQVPPSFSMLHKKPQCSNEVMTIYRVYILKCLQSLSEADDCPRQFVSILTIFPAPEL